jgi:hypothetical protein
MMRIANARLIRALLLAAPLLLAACGGTSDGNGGGSPALAPLPGGGTPPNNANPPPVVLTHFFAYAAKSSSNDISGYSIDAVTGVLTSIGSISAEGTSPVSIAVHPGGTFAYVANADSNTISAFAIDPATGFLTPGTVSTSGLPIAAGAQPVSIAVDPAGKFAYVANFTSNDVSTYSINATYRRLDVRRGRADLVGRLRTKFHHGGSGRQIRLCNE